jgi:hypothetical protein
MRHRLLLTVGCGVMGAHPARAQTSQMATPDSARLGRLDAAIELAAVRGDTAGLDTLYAADFRFTHSTGDVDGCRAWLRWCLPVLVHRARVSFGAQILESFLP